MRKLLVASFVSLDGVVESPMNWASRFFDNEGTEYALRKLDEVEFFLLGRKAYETLAPVWSTSSGNAYTDRINGLKKLVASTTLTKVTWNASLLKGDVAKVLATLKRRDGGHILKYGVTAPDLTLIENKLVAMSTTCGSCRRVSVRAKELSLTSKTTSSISSCSTRTGLRTGS
jgi:hypothetical protein